MIAVLSVLLSKVLIDRKEFKDFRWANATDVPDKRMSWRHCCPRDCPGAALERLFGRLLKI
jgi:hypothetical protein